MTCKRCGAVNDASVSFCVRCGQPLAPPASGQRTRLATTALVLGIVTYPLLCAFGLGFGTAVAAIVCGIVALVKVNREPQLFGGKPQAISGIVLGGAAFVLIPVWLIVAAIAIPSLLRARMAANESAAVGDVRAVISAQATYASLNGGFYDKLDCLAQPRGCLRGSSAPSAPLVDEQLVRASPRRGYEFALHVGPAAAQEDTAALSPSSVTRFAYVAVPLAPGTTGQRAFCGDESGVGALPSGE
jgi:type IV pilus assembly protein PilA